MWASVMVVACSLAALVGLSWIYWLRQKVSILTVQNSQLREQNTYLERDGGHLVNKLQYEAGQWKRRAEPITTLFFHISENMAWPQKAQDLRTICFTLSSLLLKQEYLEWPKEVYYNGGFRELPEFTYGEDSEEERRREVRALIQHLDIDQLIYLGVILIRDENQTIEQALIGLNITPLTPAAFD